MSYPTKKYIHPDGYTVTISTGNSKMGEISSVSLPRGITCPKDVPCGKACYMSALSARPNVRNTYEENLKCYQEYPEWFWFAVEFHCRQESFFRWNVCGDIPSEDYLEGMISVAEHSTNCRHLVFTKNYKDANAVLDRIELPENMTVVFSIWEGYPFNNRHNLPEAWVDFGKELPEIVERTGIRCRHNCMECNMYGESCWGLQRGEYVILPASRSQKKENNEQEMHLKLFEKWRKENGT